MSVNHLYHLDKNLKDCYQYDFDWSLLPDSLQKVSLLAFGETVFSFTQQTQTRIQGVFAWRLEARSS